MIIRRMKDLRGSEREVVTPNWTSHRFLLRKDGMGFSMHETLIRAGTENPMWYKNHLEAVYCVEGSGEIEDKAQGLFHAIEPGTLYALNEHDRHVLRAQSDMRLVCVFNPPCTGRETHDADGAYLVLADD